jgi:hypothetical protein
MFREEYHREREAVLRRNGGATHGAKVESLRDLSLTEADFREAVPLVHLPRGPRAKGVGF